MNRRSQISFALQWVAPVLVLACAGLFVYAMGSRPKPERKKTPPTKSVPVEVIQTRPHTGTLDIEASGVAIPFREVVISARVGGEVVFKADSLTPGHHVEKGESLLSIDPQDYALQVSRLEVELAKSDVELDRLPLTGRTLSGCSRSIATWWKCGRGLSTAWKRYNRRMPTPKPKPTSFDLHS